MGKFNKGLALGGLIGAALVWLNATKKGRQTRDEILDRAADVYERVRDRITESDAWNNLTQSKYAAMVQEVLDEYSKEEGLTDNIKNMVMKIVKMQWKGLKKDERPRRRSAV